jgi:lipoprotein-anchoring transpeptidase ErfK/SrfK
MKELVYDQAKGIVWLHDESSPEKAKRLGKGYSGHPPHVNETEAEALKARGPIPRGSYRVHRPFDHVRLGPGCMFLEPNQGNLFGRSGFLIHGDNRYGNNSASHGCIILPRAVRIEVGNLAPIDLTVV